MVSYDYDSGLKGLKQIYASMQARKVDDIDEQFEKYTSRFLSRMGLYRWWSK